MGGLMPEPVRSHVTEGLRHSDPQGMGRACGARPACQPPVPRSPQRRGVGFAGRGQAESPIRGLRAPRGSVREDRRWGQPPNPHPQRSGSSFSWEEYNFFFNFPWKLETLGTSQGYKKARSTDQVKNKRSAPRGTGGGRGHCAGQAGVGRPCCWVT